MMAWADVRGVSDAGLGSVVNPALEAEAERRTISQMNVWNPILDESCVSANPNAPANCLTTQVLVNHGHITTPMFARADLLDPLVLESNALDPRNPTDRSLIEKFATDVANILKSQSGAFGTRKRQHVMIETDEFNSYRVEGLTFAQVLGNWYFNRSGPKVVVEAPKR